MTDEVHLRRAEIGDALTNVRRRIADACVAAHRAPEEVALLVVTKTFPASDIALLADLGCVQIGESRDQEAKAKHAELASLGMRWHMIGQVQRKKARSIVGWADVVESVDRVPLAQALSAAAVAEARDLEVLIQVSLDEGASEGRGGCAPEQVPELVEAILGSPGLRLRGVMAVAPHPGDPDEAFARLRLVQDIVLAAAPEATVVSAGMSEDLEAAIRHGATQVRIGGAILGKRPAIR